MQGARSGAMQACDSTWFVNADSRTSPQQTSHVATHDVIWPVCSHSSFSGMRSQNPCSISQVHVPRDFSSQVPQITMVLAGDSSKEKKAPRSWSEQEHDTFLEGLTLHGRCCLSSSACSDTVCMEQSASGTMCRGCGSSPIRTAAYLQVHCRIYRSIAKVSPAV